MTFVNMEYRFNSVVTPDVLFTKIRLRKMTFVKLEYSVTQ